MSARVVCISRTLAAGGETVGRLVSERLGYRYIDEEIIALAGEKAQVDPELVAEAEHRKSLLARLIDALAARPVSYFPPTPEGVMYYGPEVGLPLGPAPPDFHTLIREAIVEIAAQGKAVIVAHAASLALAGSGDVLRVLVTASEKTRINRVRLSGKLATEPEAAKAVKESDRDRRAYLKEFYEVHEELPTHYDLVINTDVLLPEQAAALVVAAAGG